MACVWWNTLALADLCVLVHLLKVYSSVLVRIDLIKMFPDITTDPHMHLVHRDSEAVDAAEGAFFFRIELNEESEPLQQVCELLLRPVPEQLVLAWLRRKRVEHSLQLRVVALVHVDTLCKVRNRVHLELRQGSCEARDAGELRQLHRPRACGHERRRLGLGLSAAAADLHGLEDLVHQVNRHGRA